MIISFYGENCFKIQAGDSVILTDPVDAKSGLSAPRFKYNILLKTLAGFPMAQPEKDSVAIQNAGEYNSNGIDIEGFFLRNESSANFLKTIFLLKIEDMKICFLGHLSEMPDPDIMGGLEEVDILFVPAGGKPFADLKTIMKTIRQIQPKIVIPALYKTPGLKRPAGDLKEFLEEFNHGKVEPQEKLTIKKKDLTAIKPPQLVILKI